MVKQIERTNTSTLVEKSPYLTASCNCAAGAIQTALHPLICKVL